MRERVWVEGRNLRLEERWAEGRVERLATFAADLVRLRVDAIVASSTPAALAAQKATKTIPVVMVTTSDPIGSRGHGSTSTEYGEHEVLVNINTLAILSGNLPARALGMATEWALLHQHELRAAWERASRLQPPGKIEPLP